MVADHLPGRCPAGVSPFADDLRNGPDRLTRGDDDNRQNQQSQGKARSQDALPEAEGINEQPQGQQAINDRRHPGEIGDVDFDDVGDPVLRRVFFQIDAGGDAQRHRRAGGDEHHQNRPHPGGENARVSSTTRREGGQEIHVDAAKAIDRHVGKQCDEGHQADHQGNDAENAEHHVPTLVRGDDGAHLLQLLFSHFQYASRYFLRM